MVEHGRTLITGGAGFLGSILTRTMLGEGRCVKVLDNLSWGPEPVRTFLSHPNYEFIRGDIRNQDDIDQALDGVNAVIHLAALVGDPLCASKPDEAREVNLDATRTLIDACQKKGIDRFVFASTCSNYGISDVSVPADENRKLNPVSLYAETKVAAEQYLLDTSTCIGVMRNHPNSVNRMSAVAPGDCVISTITSYELHTGIAKCVRRTKSKPKWTFCSRPTRTRNLLCSPWLARRPILRPSSFSCPITLSAAIMSLFSTRGCLRF